MASAEFDIEISDKRVNIIVAENAQMKWRLEFQVVHFHCEQIDLFDQAGVGNDLILIDRVNLRLSQGHLSYATHVEIVHTCPPIDLLFLVISVLNGTNVQRSLVWKHQTVFD